MRTRVFTGVFLILLISICIFLGSLSFLLLVILLNHLALMEYHRLMSLAGYEVQRLTSHLLGLFLIGLTFVVTKQIFAANVLMLLLPLLGIPFALELFRKRNMPFPNASLTVIGAIWISLPLASFIATSFIPLHQHVYHPVLPLGYFLVLWCSDSAAYITGKAWGRQKLFPRISPNKTWVGSISGLAAALIAGVANSWVFQALSLEQWLVLAALIHISGSFGDLIKSMLKRSVGVKDSGHLLPGHGGILDRFDSLMGSAPFAFAYLFFST
ncbi:MAG: phosphatidate cytidylyltransferase [Flavisolibacter sp.]